MKELSIEEKAKAYDEAVEKAKMSYHTGDYDKDALEMLEIIFPELKESEDERIRKYMIKYFEANKDELSKGFRWNGITVEKCIAWLEKQGKNNMGISEATKQKLEDNLNKALESWNEFLEKQGEQKLIDKIQLGKKYKCIASPRYSTFVTGFTYKPEDKFLCSLMSLCSNCFEPIEDGEKKPADKVEPKFKVGDIIKPKDGGHEPWQIMQVDILDKKYRFKEGYVIHFSQEDDYELIEQIPAWSEEDEEEFQIAIDTLAEAGQNDSAHWLKSLKGRYTWKPSDEQMEALDEVYKTHGANNVCRRVLFNLMNDLKKLKGEKV